MKIYYFTFGSWELFPYQNTYMVVVGKDFNDVVTAFRHSHPDVSENCLNCSSYYTSEQWNDKVGKLYENQEPSEIIFTEECFGDKPEGFGDVFIYVPSVQEIVRIAEGTGSNLLEEDIKAGCVDYIYYEQHELDADLTLTDGGQVMTKQLVREKYKCLADCIPDVLSMAYGSMLVECMIL